MPRKAINAVTTLANDQSGTAARIAGSSRSTRSCAWRIANIISSKTMPLRLLALRAQINHRGLARSREITHRLVPAVRNPHRGQLAGTQQLRQVDGITSG